MSLIVEANEWIVKGTVHLSDGSPAAGVSVIAYDRDLRSEETLGQSQSDRQGLYLISYAPELIRKAEKGRTDLVVKAFGAEGRLLAASSILFNAPAEAVVDLTIAAERLAPPDLFAKIEQALKPLLEGLAVAELEEDGAHQDLTFLAGETGLDKADLARFVWAHGLARPELPAEFWFVLTGGAFHPLSEGQSLKQQLAALAEALPGLDAAAVHKALARGFNQQEIAAALHANIDRWVAAFLTLMAGRLLGGAKPGFLQQALADAGIRDTRKQQTVARLFNDHKALTPALLEALEKDATFARAEVGALRATARLNDLVQGDFSVVQMIKTHFNVRQPEQIRPLAKKSEAEWVALVEAGQTSGRLQLPIAVDEMAGEGQLSQAQVYGKMLARRFREAFPTTAFSGGLERAVRDGGASGLRHAEAMGRLLQRHEDFELLTTPVDDFLEKSLDPRLQPLARDDAFRLELKAVQRVFKLAPSFAATDALLADELHSAQKIYRLGQAEFVRRYAARPGFTSASARLAWNRAAETHAAVLTVVADLKALDAEALPRVLYNHNEALANFPNWENLFKSGDACDCAHCRSVLGPAAYFADLLTFLKDRKAKNPGRTVQEILFQRRPDLGFLELNCANALTTLPYIDVVCEVLEAAVAAGEGDLPLPGFDTLPADPAAAKAAVAVALAAQGLRLGADFTLSQVQPADPDRWIAHGDEATYLLKKKAAAHFFAQRLPNTKAGADELRAYPQYVDGQAYAKLRQARFAFSLPFDLFAEEVRVAFQKATLQRWELMQTLRGPSAPHNPGDGDIAAEYFGISADPLAAVDEKRLILAADGTIAGQQAVWGAAGANWLHTVGNVQSFLNKTGLTYTELLALLDLEFINPAGDIAIQHLDASCDTEQKTIQVLDEHKLDRMHRFLRLWRKLDGWKLWELDLVLGHPRIGNGVLNEAFLLRLFYFSRLRNRLGKNASVEQVCALFGDLNTATHFSGPDTPRREPLYHQLFLNRRLIQPIDAAFRLDAATGDLPPGETLGAHHPAILAALGLRETDLLLFKALTKASDGSAYIDDALTLANLSFLWRQAWLAKALKLTAEAWCTLLKICQQDLSVFAGPQEAWALVATVDRIKAVGFGIDGLNWLLAADRSAKAATRESDAARFLAALRKQLQAIRAEYDPGQYDFLTAAPPTDVTRLTELLTTLLQKLNRDEAATRFFIATLRDEVSVETPVAGLPAGFQFPPAITAAVRIGYSAATQTLRFTGLMTPAERTLLRTDASLAAVTGIAGYQEAIETLFNRPRLALKFFEPLFSAPLADLPAAVDFDNLPDAALARAIAYDAEQRRLRFAGIMAPEEKSALDALSAEPAYRHAVNSLFTQPLIGLFGPESLWLLDTDLQFPLRDTNLPANDHLARNLATAAVQALAYLYTSSSENAVVLQAGAQLGLGEALTRHLLARYAMLPETLLAHLTGTFAATAGAIDYATLKATFDGWFWAHRAAAIVRQWRITSAELASIEALTVGAQLLDLRTLPIDDTGPMASLDRLLATSRWLHLRDRLPETGITLLDVLTRLNAGAYAVAADFAAEVTRLNGAWSVADLETLCASLDLAFPADYLRVESWERLVRAFHFLEHLNAGAQTTQRFAAAGMHAQDAKTIQELLRAKLGAQAWLTLNVDIQDGLRERKRDGLVAYLLGQSPPADVPSGQWEHANDLYAYYLLDVEMSACQLTSRLVQASGSVQLFVQRCFMGLEPEVAVEADGAQGDSAWRWWTWMRKYRVWEAYRKVFLWPENWIEPELKRDRSTFFKDLENELLQNEVNATTVETALANYLAKLDDVAQLDIAGFYQEDDGQDTLLHLFGRTPGAEPHRYYYRRYDYRQWTPWEPVALDIQGEYLIPVVVNKRVFLFWPVFSEVPDEAGNATIRVPKANTQSESTFTMQKTRKRLRLQMAVSEYRQDQWTPKKVSKDFYQSGWITEVEIVRKFYHFLPVDRSAIDSRFFIRFAGYSLGSDGFEQAELHGAFELADCKGLPALTVLSGNFRPALQPEWASVGQYAQKAYTAFMQWHELGRPDEFGRIVGRHDHPQNDFTLENAFAAGSDHLRYTPLLVQTPGHFKMSPPWQLSFLDQLFLDGLFALGKGRAAELPAPVGSWLPFFYSDPKRTFFVRPCLSQAGPEREGGPPLRPHSYYPAVKTLFRQWEDFFAGQAQAWLDSFDLSALTVDQRQRIEQALQAQFPEEILPPYTDTQVKALLKRWLMRFYHLYLGSQALQSFQFRHFHFQNFYHPFACDFARLLHNPLQGIPALMRRETQLRDSGFSFRQAYQPTEWVVAPAKEDFYPRETVDFSPDGAYAPYNWELFYHAPLLIANALSRNQRFAEARDWYHFIFNPIGVESSQPGGSALSKYWITKPFFETTDPQYIQQRLDNLLRLLAGDPGVPGASTQAKAEIEGQVRDWRAHPFEPHRIANYRTVAYQKTVVMKYLDNLIAWGDHLFRQDSMESVNEATQLYIMAAEILGPRPRKIPPRGTPPVESYNELAHRFDAFANALVAVENLLPVMPGNGTEGLDQAPLPMLYFCIPPNDKLLGYWDTVADRLFKIRHCMNIEGLVRQLALFEPPIDPGALVKATAAGVDIGSVLADLNAPLPFYRFHVLLQKANELCNDVKSLGGALLAALEKKDAEALGLLRQGQEIQLLEAIKTVRTKQIAEAEENLAGFQKNKELTTIRRDYYRDIEKISSGERLQQELLGTALTYQQLAQVMNIAASVAHIVPSFDIGANGFGGSPKSTVMFGGPNIGSALQAWAGVFSFTANEKNHGANKAAIDAGHQRRFEEWQLQEALADKELEQIDKAIAAAELRLAIAERELENHERQIDNAKAVDDFLRSKFTSQELYQWQVGQISQVYFQSYQLAYDLARQAERCLRFELGLQASAYIQFGYWDSLKKGLLSGEKLQYDLRRLETAYLERNRREFELTKSISLLLLDPLALVQLRETGRCAFRLPEEIFDLDYPGHYFRRIKSVSLTLPCVVGPFTTLSCTLRLLKNSIRIDTTEGDNRYPHNIDDQGLPAEDVRFVEHTIPVNAIAASHGQNDSGMFELNFRDERYLPFEGAGAISEWSLELFSDSSPDFGRSLRQFDYGTISDAIVQVKYTAREETGAFKNIAVAHLREYFAATGTTPCLRLINLRQEFPTQWQRFLTPGDPAAGNIFELPLFADFFPLRDQGKTLAIHTIWLLARCMDTVAYRVTLAPPLPATPPFSLTPAEAFGGLHFRRIDVDPPGIDITPSQANVPWRLAMARAGGENLQSSEVQDLLVVLGYEWRP
jgi:hypothetical protein